MTGQDWLKPTAAPPKTAKVFMDVSAGDAGGVELDPLARLVKIVPVTQEQQQDYDLKRMLIKSLHRFKKQREADSKEIQAMAQPIRKKEGKTIPKVSRHRVSPPPHRAKKSRGTLNLRHAFAAVGCLVLLVGVVFAWQRIAPGKTGGDGTAPAVQEASKVLGIKTGETPVVMTVTDKNKVTQPFLKEAENGDQVLLYYQAKKAALVRKGTGELLAYGDFTPPPARVFLRRGSAQASLAEATALIDTDPDLSFTSQDLSPKPDYQGTIVVNITGKYDSEVSELARSLSGVVAELPAGESAPEADILVIVGSR